jgi:glycosyltransferase involved in cell wall biosynthesis
MSEHLPSVSFIIPTYNEERNIARCLTSIKEQDYPEGKVEVIVVDGMSEDDTVEVAKRYGTRIIENRKRIIGPAVKLGVENAKGEIIALLGGDSELPQRNWLKLMLAPFLKDSKVAGTIPILWPNKSYPPISRFFALMQADPIIALAYGTGKSVKGVYVTEENYFPTGVFVLRKKLAVDAGGFKSNLPRSEDVDLTYRLVKLGYKFVIVPKAGLYNLFADSFPAFVRKTNNRVSAFIGFSSICEFKYVPTHSAKREFVKNVLYDLSGIGAAARVVKGIRTDRDMAWLYYPLILVTTLFIYGIATVSSKEGQRLIRDLMHP